MVVQVLPQIQRSPSGKAPDPYLVSWLLVPGLGTGPLPDNSDAHNEYLPSFPSPLRSPLNYTLTPGSGRNSKVLPTHPACGLDLALQVCNVCPGIAKDQREQRLLPKLGWVLPGYQHSAYPQPRWQQCCYECLQQRRRQHPGEVGRAMGARAPVFTTGLDAAERRGSTHTCRLGAVSMQ